MHLQKAFIIQSVHFTESILKRNASVGGMEVKNANLRSGKLLEGGLKDLAKLFWVMIPRIDWVDPVFRRVFVNAR